MSAARQDSSAIIRDVDATTREVGDSLLWITVIGMVASLGASAYFGWKLSGHDALIAAKSVLVAATVDLLLFRWLRMAARLRKFGTQTRAGKVLDAGAVAMTYYLNGLGGAAAVIEPRSTLAWALMAVTWIFIPTVMLMSYKAMPGAQLLLQGKRDEALAEIERQQAAVLADQERTSERLRRERADLDTSRNNKAAAEANERTRQREIEDAQHARDTETRRLEIAAAIGALRGCMAAILVIGARLENAQAITEKARRQLRDRDRRQRNRQPVASAPPAHRQRTASPRRQPAPPATASAGPANKLSVDELVTLAETELATTLAMGRPALAEWLAVRAGGGRVSDHKTREVMARIQPDTNVRSLLGKAAGGHR